MLYICSALHQYSDKKVKHLNNYNGCYTLFQSIWVGFLRSSCTSLPFSRSISKVLLFWFCNFQIRSCCLSCITCSCFSIAIRSCFNSSFSSLLRCCRLSSFRCRFVFADYPFVGVKIPLPFVAFGFLSLVL